MSQTDYRAISFFNAVTLPTDPDIELTIRFEKGWMVLENEHVYDVLDRGVVRKMKDPIRLFIHPTDYFVVDQDADEYQKGIEVSQGVGIFEVVFKPHVGLTACRADESYFQLGPITTPGHIVRDVVQLKTMIQEGKLMEAILPEARVNVLFLPKDSVLGPLYRPSRRDPRLVMYVKNNYAGVVSNAIDHHQKINIYEA
jgi:hypothetical protein